MMAPIKALLPGFLALASTSRTSRRRSLAFEYLWALFMGPFILAPFSSAQQPAATSPTITLPAHHTHRRVTMNDRVKVLARNLNLDQEQQDAVLKILLARNEEALRIRRDTSISGSVRIDRFRVLQDQTALRIRAVLNEEQKKRYDPLAVRDLKSNPDQKTVEDWLELTSPK